MIRQRRAKPVNGTPPYLYTQKLSIICIFSLFYLNYSKIKGPAPVSLPQTSSSITGIQNGVINHRLEFNEDEFNDSAIEYILNNFQIYLRKLSFSIF
jgi:hypothetical protein